MFGLCKYKNLFGEPNTGLRKYRNFNIAVIDTVVTILIVYLLCLFTKWRFWSTLVIVFFLGIIAHRMFCVRTGVDKMLFS